MCIIFSEVVFIKDLGYNLNMMKKNNDNTISLISKTRKIANQFIMSEMERNKIEGLVPSHGEIILLLLSKQELTMTEISTAIHKERSTVTALIEKLKKYGYVQTKKSPNCGRTTLVYLTEKGEQLEKVFQTVSESLTDSYKQGISEEDLKTCREVLKKICENLSTLN